MRRLFLPLLLSLFVVSSNALADEYRDTVKVFQAADAPNAFFKSAYGYAVFPTIGKAGFFIGGAYGEGRVYKHNKYTGTTTMTQASVGFQLGGQAYSQIIFFEDARAYNEFTSGNFEFSAQASAIAITAGASAEAGTKGTGTSASGGQNNAVTSAKYYRGMATFVIAKGGLMYEATIAGQKFSFTPK
ncbi:MAG: lipid-binding SYLF domain-containing protein [Hydrogenovibrio crunogenus]|uniref:Ysc84 actin-binding domain-containing protein n=1 Tax=Hydrogenovibrio crunogenus (strain DSM 25203 / XCL-2) TaxID=317025 RepID=Q31JR6_HYDCU|nr:lipid-binding SYLF domain-containing protein [Hydrogenovibrio crunogenus]